MEQIIGIDLAKRVFQVHVASFSGQTHINKMISRDKLPAFIAQQPPSLIVTEACGSANFWARKCLQYGHEVKQISPQYVSPFRMGNKNDKNDAIAIVEAACRSGMRYVPGKSIRQQDMQCLHRVRQRLMKNRTALINQIRGLALEYGIAMPEGAHKVTSCLPGYLEDAENELTTLSRELFQEMLLELQDSQQRIKTLDVRLKQMNAQNEDTLRLENIPGVGSLGASALTIALGDSKDFNNGRHFASYLGLVPGEHSSGGKTRLQGITKRGDGYLRGLLIHGARSVVYRTVNLPDERCSHLQRWLKGIIARCGVNKAVVALANKNARIAWALVNQKTDYITK
ncbi:IS110 family transposase [Pectobacterium carotovorum subsp. carotovorum]|uniref:IS110 family transposase n=1 Tax=Pectobacterium carotovorum TaxID=554 RepID=UPI0013742481|nr:IS110 family transposase [Pectobacterium carotovorum]QHP53817.1 IS110 family transposase [Pectobacterium carotovorum subsp. carotovorum]